MISRRKTAAALGVLALVAMTLGAGVTTADFGGQPPEEDYTLEELQDDGKHYSVPSGRIVPSERRLYWLEHRAVNRPWQDVTKEKNGKKLGEDAVLKTNKVYLRTIRAQTDTETINVTIVSYDIATREVKRGNVTTTEKYAANVSVIHRSVTLEPGWSVAELTLPQHSEKTHITMWVDEHPETARWTFEHKSVATTTPIDADNYGEFLILGFAFIIGPALGGGWYGGRKVKASIKKAGAPPGHGFTYYLLVTTLLTFGILYWGYYQAAELIVTLPMVLGLYVAAVYMGYMLASHEGHTSTVVLFQAYVRGTEEFMSANIPGMGGDGDDGTISFSEEITFGKMNPYQLLDEGKRGLSIVRPGWWAFLARLKGGRALIENAEELKTRFNLTDSFASECILVDPEADSLIEYEPPGLALKTPEIEEWSDLTWPLILLGISTLLAWRATQIYGTTAWAILIVMVPYFIWKFAVTGTDSYVHIDPAPPALQNVLATHLTMSLGLSGAKSIDEAERFAYESLAQSRLDSEEAETRRAAAVTERVLGDRVEEDVLSGDAPIETPDAGTADDEEEGGASADD